MFTRRVRRVIVPFATAMALIAGTAVAQQTSPQGQTPGSMPGQGMGQDQGMTHGQGQGMHPGGQRAQTMPKDPASRAYMESMRKMNSDMRKPMTGDADQDFARMMAAHHQGAIDMARVELQYGKDPDLKAMAQKVIDDQTKEIQELQDWLKQHPAKQAVKK